jgi:hypothetical protein
MRQVTEDKEKLKEALLSCDIIVYDLVAKLEESSWAIECNFLNLI